MTKCKHCSGKGYTYNIVDGCRYLNHRNQEMICVETKCRKCDGKGETSCTKS